LKRIEEDKELAVAFENPQFTHLFTLMSQNPGKINDLIAEFPQFKTLLQKFLLVLSEEFEGYGIKQEKQELEKNIKDLPRNEQDLIRRIQQDPEAQKLLTDPKIQNLLGLLRSDPVKGAR
jgi:TFIIF-interacting CTD phosphatase-like protein